MRKYEIIGVLNQESENKIRIKIIIKVDQSLMEIKLSSCRVTLKPH